MGNIFQLGSRVRHRHDDGWGSPGCVMSRRGDKLHVYWPDENLFTDELPGDLAAYGIESASQPQKAAA